MPAIKAPTRDRYLLVCIASAQVGFGHLNRCLSLANVFRSHGADVDFVVFGDKKGQKLIQGFGYKCRKTNFDAAVDHNQVFTTNSLEHNHYLGVIVDVAHESFLRRRSSIETCLDVVRQVGEVLVFFDTIEANSLTPQFPEISIDIIVIPKFV